MSTTETANPVAPTIIERVVPGEAPEGLYTEHLSRYRFACSFVTDKVVLDVACGAGYGGPILLAGGARRYVGVDISNDAVAVANRRYQTSPELSFAIDDACNLDTIPDATIEVVVSFETVEHLQSPQLFLKNVHRVLKPNGIFVISTPNRTRFSPGHSLTSKPANPFHLREWNKSEFLDLLSEFFHVDETFGQDFCPAWKAFILFEAARRRWVRWLVQKYMGTKQLVTPIPKRGRNPLESQEFSPVLPIRSWQTPLYLLCVASPRGRNAH
jgi:SAM-dependent methyltransferase